jgi:pimeloyl-ACP methyl ester carboxylesterase
VVASRRVAISTGIEIAFDEHGRVGAEPPLVLLHAWGEGRGSFDRLWPLLLGDLHVLVPDLRGSGESSKPARGYSVPEGSADVVAFLTALDVSSAWLVGTSSGGYLAQQVAVDSPDRVRGLVLVGTPRSLRGRGDPFGSVLASLSDPVTRADLVSLGAVIPTSVGIPPDFAERQAQDALAIPATAWRAGYAGLRDAVPPTDAGRIDAPTLILWGADDDLLGREEADELQRAIPGSELRVYEDTGHLVLWERPELVAQDLVRFVTSVG